MLLKKKIIFGINKYYIILAPVSVYDDLDETELAKQLIQQYTEKCMRMSRQEMMEDLKKFGALNSVVVDPLSDGIMDPLSVTDHETA